MRSAEYSKHHAYRDIGGVAYYHVADTYIAIFSRFAPCRTWEAIYIIDGLLKNRSDIQPRKVHADTQGQSVTVFALSHLLGIELLPCIRNWKDLIFYKADARLTYKHLEPLYGGVIDWDYLERHWQDLMPVVISIQEGKILSEMVLRKLGNDSKKNRLYRVFQELGRVIRTLFLLRYISDQQLREAITAGTNKVESHDRFVKWFRYIYDIVCCLFFTISRLYPLMVILPFGLPPREYRACQRASSAQTRRNVVARRHVRHTPPTVNAC